MEVLVRWSLVRRAIIVGENCSNDSPERCVREVHDRSNTKAAIKLVVGGAGMATVGGFAAATAFANFIISEFWHHRNTG